MMESASSTRPIQDLWPLPDGWNWYTLKDIVLETEQRNPSRVPDKLLYYIDISSIDNNDGTIRNAASLAGRDAPSRARKVIREGDVIFATTRPYLRNIAVVPRQYDDQMCSTGFCVLRANPDIVDSKWIYRLCRSGLVMGQITPKMRGANYPAVTDNDVLSVWVPLPPIDTQYSIIARIEALLAEVKESRELLKTIRQDTEQLMDAVLREVFDPTVTGSWSNVDDLGCVTGITSKLVDPREAQYSSLHHIGADAIESRTCRLTRYKTAAEDAVKSLKYCFGPNTVLYSKIRPYLRKTAYVDFTGLCSADVYPLTIIREQVDPKFLMWVLVSDDFTSYAIAKSARARMPKINRTDLFAYRFRYPSIDEQRMIVNHIESVQAGVSEMKPLLDSDMLLIDQLEQSILEQAFRGKL